MIYADTDFFLALMKPSDWLKRSAGRILKEHVGEFWTSSAVLLELLLLGKRLELDPEWLLINLFEIATVGDGTDEIFLRAARYMRDEAVGVFDAVHAAYCGEGKMIVSSDKVFDRLGLKRIPLESVERKVA